MPGPMTAEEFIEERKPSSIGRRSMPKVAFAKALVSVEDLQSLITAHRRDARREALVEAAKAVCGYCSEKLAERRDGYFTWWHWCGTYYEACSCSETHDLIAQHDAENIAVSEIAGTDVGDTTTRLNAALAQHDAEVKDGS